MGYIDIHTHLIPDVDDGSRGFEDSIRTIRLLNKFGIDTIVATPHKRTGLFEFQRDKIIQNFQKLKERIAEEEIDTSLYLGCEYYYGPDLFEDISNKEVLTLGGSDYILVEFKSLRFSDQDRESLFRIFTSGYRIIVAHIERHRYNAESMASLDYLRDNSVLFQCDIMSLSGLWGEQVKLFMVELLKRGYVNIISTDVHCKEFEEDLLRKGFDTLKEIAGDDILEISMGEKIKKRLNLL